MSEEKQKRIVVAMTVAGVLLSVFLLVILIVQFVQIGVLNAQARKYEQQKAAYQKACQQYEKDLNYYQSQDGLYILALKNGWITPEK